VPSGKDKGKSGKAGFVQDQQVAFRTELGERVRWLLDQFDTRAEAARIATVTPEHLASYIAGRAKPPFELMARLARAKGVSLDWIASGSGERIRDDAAPEGFALVALRDSEPAGDVRYDEADETAPLAFPRAWLREAFDAEDGDLVMVIHRGPANEPVLRDGDLLLVDRRMRTIGEDGFYVFERDGRLQTKLVETFLDGRVALKSRNPDFAPQILSAEDAARLALLGRVRWRGGSF
jgi:phage repressor protein C with HTH and peptisase S24 domain